MFKKVVITITAVVFVAASFLFTLNYMKTQKVKEYEDRVSQFTPSSVSEVVELSKTTKDRYFVLVGVKTCPHCQEFVPKLQDTLTSTGFDFKKVYYIGFDKVSDIQAVSPEEYRLLSGGVNGVPLLVKIVNGVIVPPYDGGPDLRDYLLY
jgi:hypothetical protein